MSRDAGEGESAEDGRDRRLRLIAATARAAAADPVGMRPARRAAAAIARALPGADVSLFLKVRGARPLARIAAAGGPEALPPPAEGDGVADFLTVAFTRSRAVVAGPGGDMGLPAAWADQGVRWAAAAVLRSRDQAFGGLVVRGRDASAPDAATIQFIETLADLAALGLLARARKPALDEDRDMSAIIATLMDCEERERTRLSRELHDEANQSLVSLILGLSVLDRQVESSAAHEQIARLREQTVTVLDSLRRVAQGLRPPELGELGLGPALQGLCDTFSSAHGLKADFYHVDQACPCRSPLIDLALYRIVQEALANVARHAEASQVAVVLACRGGLVTVQIEDDGKGWAPAEPQPGDAPCLGVLGMKERAGLLGGRVQVEVSPGGGTTVYVEIPADYVDGVNGYGSAD